MAWLLVGIAFCFVPREKLLRTVIIGAVMALLTAVIAGL